jgi:hypothetical protein
VCLPPVDGRRRSTDRRCQPVRPDLIEADVFVNGTAIGHVAFRDRDGFEEYTVRL